ncbi:hypothetical protein [Ferrimonas senticii]|uniref:hypothetical protein n=1 Tax=Ferrimonas senticii TaxID=394566 RepID=UPI00040D22CF|nr:hypothetical protein [Ferrimonas senticii]
MNQALTGSSPTQGQLRLTTKHGRISHCQSQLQLPPLASLLNGRNYTEISQRLQLVYSQCAEAHRWAALSLVEPDTAVNGATHDARAQALWLEWVSEHSWQLWRSAQLLLPACEQRMLLLAQWRQQLASLRQQLAPNRYQCGVRASAAPLADLLPWQARWQQLVYQPLQQAIIESPWAAQFVTEHACMARFESGAAVRQPPSQLTIAARFAGLWQECWQAAQWLLQPAAGQSPLLGAGTIAAARGTLVHRCHWHSGVADHYQIQIPTEGLLASISQSLLGTPYHDCPQSRLGLTLWLQSHAPCVDIEITVTEEPSDA